MSLYDYNKSQELVEFDFHALLMGTIRKADDINLFKLKSVFPTEVEEFRKRYNAPGGKLETD